ncbi:hypothetical protein [Clostridium thermarum]|uniref:hypothetical protein n=1 Tax=Clostridium thermarum TaxID=1716543 RepID=UPI00193F8EA9|nr:hypothetical protein [Clostridium thermarum]
MSIGMPIAVTFTEIITALKKSQIIYSNRKDEFGYVYRTFYNMSSGIKNLINTVYKKEIAIKDAD